MWKHEFFNDVVVEHLKTTVQSTWPYKKRITVRSLLYGILGLFSMSEIYVSILSRSSSDYGNRPYAVTDDQLLAEAAFPIVVVGLHPNETTATTPINSVESIVTTNQNRHQSNVLLNHNNNNNNNGCTSPESDLPWPVDKFAYYYYQNVDNQDSHGTTENNSNQQLSSSTSHLSCDLSTPSPFTWFLRETMGKTVLGSLLKRYGCRHVVFGTAFTDESEQDVRRMIVPGTNVTDEHPEQKNHNADSTICSFVFIIGEFLGNEHSITENRFTRLDHHDDSQPTTTTTSPSTTTTPVFLLPIPRHVLPYNNMQRNAMLVKYMGHLIFLQQPTTTVTTTSSRSISQQLPQVRTVTWQDTRFFFFFSGRSSTDNDDDNNNHRHYHHHDNQTDSGTSYIRHRGRGGHGRFRRKPFFLPSEYYRYDDMKVHLYDRPCVTAIALLPVVVIVDYPNTTNDDDGPSLSSSYGNRLLLQQQQHQYCQSLWFAMLRTLSSIELADIVQQCEMYVQRLWNDDNGDNGDGDDENNNNNNHNSGSTSNPNGENDHPPMILIDNRKGLDIIDTSYLIWNESTEQCRRFNTQFRCNVMKEIHCHAGDTDLLAVPFVMYHQMGLTMLATSLSTTTTRDYDQSHNDYDVDWVLQESHRRSGDDATDDGQTACTDRPVMVRIIRNDCHWDRNGDSSHDCQNLRMPTSDVAAVNTTTSNTGVTSDADDILVSHDCMRTIKKNHDVGSRGCTSPERDVPWPLGGEVSSKTSNVTCGLSADSPTSAYFRDTLLDKTLSVLTKNCTDLVVYGVAFGRDFVNDMNKTITDHPTRFDTLLQQHGRCFFMFTTNDNDGGLLDGQRTTTTTTIVDDPIMLGHYWLVSIPPWALPYRNPRRNAKLLKYAGRLLFPNTGTLIWQDAKFFNKDLQSQLPADYRHIIQDVPACVTAIGLREHPNTVGKDRLDRGDHFHVEHCKTVKRAIERRPNVTDSAGSILQQCQRYIYDVQGTMGNYTFLDRTMVDTAFIVWDESTEQCRDFNSGLRCTMLDELHCYSDRDQISLPYALYKQQQQHENTNHNTTPLMITYRGGIPLDERYSPEMHDIDLIIPTIHNNHNISRPSATTTIDEDGTEAADAVGGGVVIPITPSPPMVDRSIMVRIIRSNCHWYKAGLGRDCKYWKQH